MAHKTTKKNKRKTMSPDKKGKVNISSVNQKQKTSKVTKLSSTLKKQKGPKRDNLGQFTSGTGGLNVFKKFNFKRALPLIIFIALLGGLLVFQSFAATATESYVRDLYKYCLGRTNPDTAGLQYWVREIDSGNRTRANVEQYFRAQSSNNCAGLNTSSTPTGTVRFTSPEQEAKYKEAVKAMNDYFGQKLLAAFDARGRTVGSSILMPGLATSCPRLIEDYRAGRLSGPPAYCFAAVGLSYQVQDIDSFAVMVARGTMSLQDAIKYIETSEQWPGSCGYYSNGDPFPCDRLQLKGKSLQQRLSECNPNAVDYNDCVIRAQRLTYVNENAKTKNNCNTSTTRDGTSTTSNTTQECAPTKPTRDGQSQTNGTTTTTQSVVLNEQQNNNQSGGSIFERIFNRVFRRNR